jgi:thiamine biosynthesis lipoprotein
VLAADDSSTPPDGEGEAIAIVEGAVATSSTIIRRWQRGGIDLHHLIDPWTGLPAVTPWRTVTVVAATCVDANAAATAAVVRGDGGLAWLESTGLAARLVANDGSVLRVGGWPTPAAQA